MTAGAPVSADVHFRCGCGHPFRADPARTEAAPERGNHPFAYFAPCPECHEEANQAPWEIGLYAAQGRQTGPKTAAGKQASAANLAGHPDAQAQKRTRFNALKHGMAARTATFFPARPGKYPHCDGCELEEAPEVCKQQLACVKRMEIFLRHHAAFEAGDPRQLQALNADLQSNVRALLDDIIRTLILDGVKIETPEWYEDKETGQPEPVSFVDPQTGRPETLKKIQAHPLLRTLLDALGKNNLSLHDMAMTPRGQDDLEVLEGHLAGQRQDRLDADDYQRRQEGRLQALQGMIDDGRRALQADPVRIEYDDSDESGDDR